MSNLHILQKRMYRARPRSGRERLMTMDKKGPAVYVKSSHTAATALVSNDCRRCRTPPGQPGPSLFACRAQARTHAGRDAGRPAACGWSALPPWSRSGPEMERAPRSARPARRPGERAVRCRRASLGPGLVVQPHHDRSARLPQVDVLHLGSPCGQLGELGRSRRVVEGQHIHHEGY